LDHDSAFIDEALKCLKNENLLPSSVVMPPHDLQEYESEFSDEGAEAGVPFVKGAYDMLTPSEQEKLLSAILAENSQGVIQIPLSDVRQCYKKEMGENCDDALASKIASQVARDLDFHKSVHQQIREACQAATDQNMLSLLSI
jgi:hypothetical protein